MIVALVVVELLAGVVIFAALAALVVEPLAEAVILALEARVVRGVAALAAAGTVVVLAFLATGALEAEAAAGAACFFLTAFMLSLAADFLAARDLVVRFEVLSSGVAVLTTPNSVQRLGSLSVDESGMRPVLVREP